MAMVLPIHDSGQHNAIVDYQLFSDLEKDLWHYQIAFWISEHHPNLQTLIEVAPEEPPQDDAAPGESTQVEAAPEQPSHAVYYVSGTNVRVNINSVDSSVNVVEQSPVEVFQQLLTAVQSTTIDPELIATMTAAIEDMQRNYGTEYFAEDYRAFMAILADHIQVFGAVVAPYLPALAQLLPSN
jgi:hypothetical protein